MVLFLFFWASLFHDENSTLLMDKFDLFIFRDLATLYLKFAHGPKEERCKIVDFKFHLSGFKFQFVVGFDDDIIRAQEPLL